MKAFAVALITIFILMIGCCGWIANAALPDTRIIDATEYADTMAMVRTALESQDHAANAAMMVKAMIGPAPINATATVTITAGEFNRNFGVGGSMEIIQWTIIENAFLGERMPTTYQPWMFKPTDGNIAPHVGISPAVPDATASEELRIWLRRLNRKLTR